MEFTLPTELQPDWLMPKYFVGYRGHTMMAYSVPDDDFVQLLVMQIEICKLLAQKKDVDFLSFLLERVGKL